MPRACESSQARDRAPATAVTMLDPSLLGFKRTLRSQFYFILFYLFIYLFCLFAFSWAASAAYGGSQARVLIRATATGLHHSHSQARSELHLQPTPQLTTTPDPLSKTRDRTQNIMVPSWTHFHCAMMGTPSCCFISNILSYWVCLFWTFILFFFYAPLCPGDIISHLGSWGAGRGGG